LDHAPKTLLSTFSVEISSLNRAGIEWFMGWPSGVKLNTELDLFLGNLFLIYLNQWGTATDVASSIGLAASGCVSARSMPFCCPLGFSKIA